MMHPRAYSAPGTRLCRLKGSSACVCAVSLCLWKACLQQCQQAGFFRCPPKASAKWPADRVVSPRVVHVRGQSKNPEGQTVLLSRERCSLERKALYACPFFPPSIGQRGGGLLTVPLFDIYGAMLRTDAEQVGLRFGTWPLGGGHVEVETLGIHILVPACHIQTLCPTPWRHILTHRVAKRRVAAQRCELRNTKVHAEVEATIPLSTTLEKTSWFGLK